MVCVEVAPVAPPPPPTSSFPRAHELAPLTLLCVLADCALRKCVANVLLMCCQQTVYYANVLKKDVGESLGILSEMLLRVIICMYALRALETRTVCVYAVCMYPLCLCSVCMPYALWKHTYAQTHTYRWCWFVHGIYCSIIH
jgi:hypothetical protein